MAESSSALARTWSYENSLTSRAPCAHQQLASFAVHTNFGTGPHQAMRNSSIDGGGVPRRTRTAQSAPRAGVRFRSSGPAPYQYDVSRFGSVALSVGMIEAGLSSEVIDPLSAVAASKVGVRRVPVPARGDRGRGALVSAVQPVLSRR
jgi:hypothetical protein